MAVPAVAGLEDGRSRTASNDCESGVSGAWSLKEDRRSGADNQRDELRHILELVPSPRGYFPLMLVPNMAGAPTAVGAEMFAQQQQDRPRR